MFQADRYHCIIFLNQIGDGVLFFERKKLILSSFVTMGLIFQPLGPDDLAGDLEYADVDFRSYGPINYKAASIYALVKKQKNGSLKEVQQLLSAQLKKKSKFCKDSSKKKDCKNIFSHCEKKLKRCEMKFNYRS